MKQLLFSLLAISLLLPLTHAQSDESDTCLFKTLLDQFEEAYETQNIELLEDLYGSTVTYLPGSPDAGIQNRSQLFKHVFKPMVTDQTASYSIEFRIAECDKRLDWGFVAGYYRFLRKPNQDEAFESFGKFLLIIEKDISGKWKIRIDSDSSCPSERWKEL